MFGFTTDIELCTFVQFSLTSGSGYQCRGQGNIEVGESEVQTIGGEIGSRKYCTTRGIEPIFCNNCKLKVTIKNCIKNFLKI